ncbi:glycosyltransferase family 4 protein [SAR86 cluster bacterium]|nr:glycosyltransferase family 4 protein [SAR86 cluster bacterium]
MKVLAVIITSPGYSVSGAVTAAKNLSIATSKLCDVRLAVMSDKNSEEQKDNLIIKNFKCQNILSKISGIIPSQLKNYFWTSEIDKYIEDFKPDIVHFHNPVPPMALWKLAQTCIKNKIPYVITSHGFVEMFDYKKSYNIGTLKGLAIYPMIMSPFLRTLKNAAGIFLLSPNEKEILNKNIKFNNTISVVPNGYDKKYDIEISNNLLDQCVSKFNIKPNKPTFLFMGNHTYNKGIDIILNSLKYIDRDIQILIGGKIRSKKENELLISKCDLLENEDRYVFTDFLTDEEAIALYKIADCFVFPSRADTFPLVILEAMVSNLPVISTKIGGIPYQINRDCGILIEPNSSKDLATAIKRLIDSPEDIIKMGNNSRKRVMENFSWDTSADLAINEYSNILSSI